LSRGICQSGLLDCAGVYVEARCRIDTTIGAD
jgi:hypothetical protein